ncbi:MAG: AAA family ATPase [Methanoregula sp.]
MSIKRISATNFKSFAALDVNLPRFSIVIGSNAAGKSNFINLFRFLRDISRHGLVNAIALQGGADYLRNATIGDSRNLEVRVVFEPESRLDVLEQRPGDTMALGIRSCESTYEFALRFGPTDGNPEIAKDILVIGFDISTCGPHATGFVEKDLIGRGHIKVCNVNGELHYHLDIPQGCSLKKEDIIPLFYRKKQLPQQTLLIETPYAYPLPHVEKFFDRIAIYDINPKLPKKGVQVTGKTALDEDGGNLALAVKKILDDPEKKRKFSNLLKDTLPFVEDFSVKKFMDVSLMMTLRERYAKSLDLPASSLSDGTITIFALIIVLYFEERPFIIIEEPASHIHPFLVSRVIAMMQESSRREQVMITTHSTEVVKHACLDDILLISRDSEGYSVISRPADKEEVKTFLENEIGIDDLYVQNLLGL